MVHSFPTGPTNSVSSCRTFLRLSTVYSFISDFELKMSTDNGAPVNLPEWNYRFNIYVGLFLFSGMNIGQTVALQELWPLAYRALNARWNDRKNEWKLIIRLFENSRAANTEWFTSEYSKTNNDKQLKFHSWDLLKQLNSWRNFIDIHKPASLKWVPHISLAKKKFSHDILYWNIGQ